METLINVIYAMLDRAFYATVSENLVSRIFFFGFMIALLVLLVSALRLGIQFIIKKSRQ